MKCEIEDEIYTRAFKPGCLMSHNWLHTPDCKIQNETLHQFTQKKDGAFTLSSPWTMIMTPMVRVVRP